MIRRLLHIKEPTGNFSRINYQDETCFRTTFGS